MGWRVEKLNQGTFFLLMTMKGFRLTNEKRILVIIIIIIQTKTYFFTIKLFVTTRGNKAAAVLGANATWNNTNWMAAFTLFLCQSLLFCTNLLFWQGFGAVVRSHREPLRPTGQSQVTPVSAPSQHAPWAHTLHEWHPARMASPFMWEWKKEQSVSGGSWIER